MIACPLGWSSESRDRVLVLHSPQRPGGESAAELRYREDVRPLLAAPELVAEVLRHQLDFQPAQQSRPELGITAEGEYTTLVRVRGLLGDRPVWLIIGAVFAEDSMNVFITLVREATALAEVAHIVRGLLYADRLGLGVRKRRFLYDPPPGWQPRPSGLLCSWFPPDYPRPPATLVAHPAMPRDSTEEAVVVAFIKAYQKNGFLVDALTDGEPVTTDAGLQGKAFCLIGRFPDRPELTCDLLVLADARYLYALILESGAQARRTDLQTVLPAVARSIRPIPLPASAPPPASSAPSSLNYWSF